MVMLCSGLGWLVKIQDTRPRPNKLQGNEGHCPTQQLQRGMLHMGQEACEDVHAVK